MDPRLQQILDNAKHPISKAILRGLFEDDNFKEYMRQRLEHLVGKKRAKVGYDMTNECWTWGKDDELEEGIASGLMHLVKTTAAKSLATGLGVSPSTIHGFTKHLSSKPKKVAGPLRTAQKPAKPVHTKPAGATLHTSPIYHTVLPHDVHSKIGHPDHIEHDQRLSDFINHHNRAMDLKAKGDKSGAAVAFRARNHALVRYTQTAPKAHLKYLNADKVQQMMAIKE